MKAQYFEDDGTEALVKILYHDSLQQKFLECLQLVTVLPLKIKIPRYKSFDVGLYKSGPQTAVIFRE